MLANILVVFAVIGVLSTLGVLIRAFGLKRISFEFYEQPPLLKRLLGRAEENEDPPKQLKQ